MITHKHQKLCTADTDKLIWERIQFSNINFHFIIKLVSIQLFLYLYHLYLIFNVLTKIAKFVLDISKFVMKHVVVKVNIKSSNYVIRYRLMNT